MHDLIKPPSHHGPERYGSQSPRSLEYRTIGKEAEKDAELLTALRIAREQLGDEHPLVKDALKSLRGKERRRFAGSGDGLTAEVSGALHSREHELSAVLSGLLREEPIHEARLSGFGNRRVDMLFLGHRLVVEENGIKHTKQRTIKQRDADLRELCTHLGLRLLEVDYREPLTEDHLRERLNSIGAGC